MENTNHQVIEEINNEGAGVEKIGNYELRRFEQSHLIIDLGSGLEITICKHRFFQHGEPIFSVISGVLQACFTEIAIKKTFRTEIVCSHDGIERAVFPIRSEQAATRIIEIVESGLI